MNMPERSLDPQEYIISDDEMHERIRDDLSEPQWSQCDECVAAIDSISRDEIAKIVGENWYDECEIGTLVKKVFDKAIKAQL